MDNESLPAIGRYRADLHPNAKKRDGNIQKQKTFHLKAWFRKNTENPYPTSAQKTDFCDTLGLDKKQVNNWFINARRRQIRRLTEEGAAPAPLMFDTIMTADTTTAATARVTTVPINGPYG